MRHTSAIGGIVGLMAGLLLLGSEPLSACNQVAPPKEVKVSVVSILASEKSTEIDSRLAHIAKEIQRVRPQLTGFRLARMTCQSVPVQGIESFELVGDQQATITVLKAADTDDRVQLKISPPTLGEITYTTTCGKFFPIVTKYQTSNGEVLIIAVRVQPCNKSK